MAFDVASSTRHKHRGVVGYFVYLAYSSSLVTIPAFRASSLFFLTMTLIAASNTNLAYGTTVVDGRAVLSNHSRWNHDSK